MSISQIKKYILLIVASIFLLSSCSPFRQMNNSGKPLDVLIITDNRKFNREAFLQCSTVLTTFAGQKRNIRKPLILLDQTI